MPRVIHFELPADDPQRAIEFYTSAFGWKIEKWDGPMEYYLVYTGGPDEPGIDGAIVPRTDEPLCSNLTVGVDSVDKVVSQVTAVGGIVVAEKHAIPGIGWVATVKDSEGNTLGIMSEDPDVEG